MYAPNYGSEVVVQRLEYLLARLRRCEIQVPARKSGPWDLDATQELFRSIRDGIPIGSVMLWRTVQEVDCEDVGAEGSPDSRRVKEYLIDGADRLLAIYSALYHSNVHYYDLTEKAFRFVPEGLGTEDLAVGNMPLSVLTDCYDLIHFERQLPDRRLVNRAHALDNRFRKALVPVFSVVTDDLGMAARTCAAVGNDELAARLAAETCAPEAAEKG